MCSVKVITTSTLADPSMVIAAESPSSESPRSIVSRRKGRRAPRPPFRGRSRVEADRIGFDHGLVNEDEAKGLSSSISFERFRARLP